MKNIYILLSFALITLVSYGQNKQIENADKLCDSYQFVDAIKSYSKIVEDNNADAHVYKQLADSYYNIYNIEDASKWYAKAVEYPQDAETHYRYAQVLKSQGEYELANKEMNKFAEMIPSDQRAKDYLENPNFVSHMYGQEIPKREFSCGIILSGEFRKPAKI